MIRSEPLKRDASSEVNFKVPIYRTGIWDYNSDPKIKIIPTILSQLSSLEVILDKRAACESLVDYTNAESIDAMNKSLDTLKELSTQQEAILTSSLRFGFSDSTISYFLFQYNLANLFPRCAVYFNSPVDPFGSEKDHNECLEQFMILNSVFFYTRTIQNSLNNLPNDEIRIVMDNLSNLLRKLDKNYFCFQESLIEISQSLDLDLLKEILQNLLLRVNSDVEQLRKCYNGIYIKTS